MLVKFKQFKKLGMKPLSFLYKDTKKFRAIQPTRSFSVTYVNVINVEKELGKDNLKYNFFIFWRPLQRVGKNRGWSH